MNKEMNAILTAKVKLFLERHIEKLSYFTKEKDKLQGRLIGCEFESYNIVSDIVGEEIKVNEACELYLDRLLEVVNSTEVEGIKMNTQPLRSKLEEFKEAHAFRLREFDALEKEIKKIDINGKSGGESFAVIKELHELQKSKDRYLQELFEVARDTMGFPYLKSSDLLESFEHAHNEILNLHYGIIQDLEHAMLQENNGSIDRAELINKKDKAYEYLSNYVDQLLEVAQGAYTDAKVSKEEPEVIHPSQYNQMEGLETIEYIRAVLSPEEFRGFLKGNIMKYRDRAPYKGNPTSDYSKAVVYYDWLEPTEGEK